MENVKLKLTFEEPVCEQNQLSETKEKKTTKTKRNKQINRRYSSVRQFKDITI